jgi:uncharacterized membrane protein YbhN (UPF0104 family)
MPNNFAIPFVDEATFAQLIFLAVVAYLTAAHLATLRSKLAGMIAFGTVLPLYFFHRFTFDAKFESLFEALVRSLLISHVTGSAAMVVATAWTLARVKIRDAQSRAEIERRRKEWELERQRLEAERNKPRPAPPPAPPPPTFSERMDALAKKAREEYDAEMRALDSLPLDEDEREVLVNRAKRNLLRKLKEAN